MYGQSAFSGRGRGRGGYHSGSGGRGGGRGHGHQYQQRTNSSYHHHQHHSHQQKRKYPFPQPVASEELFTVDMLADPWVCIAQVLVSNGQLSVQELEKDFSFPSM